MRTRSSIALTFLLAASGLGCGGDDEPDIATVTQRWTIEGTRDVGRCQAYGAARMRLVLFDSNGSVVATQFAPCIEFQQGVGLTVGGTYSGSATFLGATGLPVSDTLAVQPFIVEPSAGTSFETDFPREAMGRP